MSDSIEKLKQKYFYGLPLSLDDSLSYEDCKNGIIEKINSLIETSSKSYEEIIAKMEADLASMKENVSKNLSNSIEKRQSSFSALENEISSLESERKAEDEALIKALEEAIASIKEYYSKGYFIIYDSNLGGSSNGFAQYLKDNLKFREVYIYGVPGFSAYQAKQFFVMYSPNIPNKSRITDIILLTGGTDDNTSGSFSEIITYISENFPNATLSVGYLGHPKWPNKTATGYETACKESGAIYIKATKNLCASPSLWNSDFTTFSGGETIAPYLMEAIIYKNTTYSFERTQNITLSTTMSDLTLSENSLKFIEKIDQLGYSFSLESTINISGENPLPNWIFMTLASSFSENEMSIGDIGNHEADESAKARCTGSSFNSQLYPGEGRYPGYFYIKNGVLMLKMMENPSNTSAYPILIWAI